MEDIKFRAWDKKNTRMLYDLRMFDISYVDDKLSIIKLKKCPLMLCSLLTDRNGTEIYEDDILVIPYNREGNVIVKYKDGKFNVSAFNLKSCEVVGNIYQNPELIGRYASRERYNQIKDKNSQGI